MKKYLKKYLVPGLSKLYNILESANQLHEYNGYRKKYNIHSSFIFNGKGILFYGDGKLELGEHSYIGRHSSIQISENYEVSIGDNCKIGPFFCIWTQTSYVDHDFNFEDTILPKIGNIIINNGVWIGANVVISPGVTVGENSIIGANSVVTKDVPPYAIVGGIPAKIIRFKKIEMTNNPTITQ